MMDDNTKMLRMLINGQSSLKSDMMGEFKKLREEIKSVEVRLSEKIDKVDIKLTKRIDRIGLDLAALSDDAPTIKEFDELSARVKKLQTKIALN